MDIEIELAKLTPEIREKFEELLLDVLNDRSWCLDHRIDYIDPDIKNTKELLYNDMFTQAGTYQAFPSQ